MDAPQTPGDWLYRATSDGSTAMFGRPGNPPSAWLTCRRAGGVVEISAAGAISGPMIVRTESVDRPVNLAPAAQEPPAAVARVPAQDSLLDAMAYSKGRFALEAAGAPPLYLPAWPEVARVIEDCR